MLTLSLIRWRVTVSITMQESHKNSAYNIFAKISQKFKIVRFFFK